MAGLSSFDGYGGYYAQQIVNQTPAEASFIREYYRMLFAYYQQNGLYDYIAENLQSTRYNDRVVKPLRNPAWRVVEFYSSKIFPGVLPRDLPIIGENADRLIEPIHFVWNRSNLSSRIAQWSRWFAIFGDWFIKINIDEEKTKVWFELILPEYVTSFEEDERGYLTKIRIDVPYDSDGDNEVDKYHTEFWDKETETVQVWEHEQGLDKEFDELGTPTTTGFQEMYGDNFIPIVYQSFREDGGGRGSSAYSAQLDKIDEVNRQATRLAQTLFRYNRALWAIETSGVDAAGRPLPVVGADALQNDDGNVQIGDDTMLSLPANSRITTLVPPINFDAALRSLESQMSELAADLPELTYFELTTGRGGGSQSEMSGRAIRFLLDGMISRVEQARSSAESALVRANQIAITVGQNNGVFPRVGEFIDGALDHSFAERPILPRDIYEEAQTFAILTNGGMSIEAAAKFIGMNEEEAAAMAEVGTYFEREIGGR